MPLATRESYRDLLLRAKRDGYALPAIAVSSSETINAVLSGLAEAESDGILQVSPTSGGFASGKLANMAMGATALARYATELATGYPIEFALHTDHCGPQRLREFLLPLLHAGEQSVRSGQEPLFQSQMFDGSSLPLPHNLAISKYLLERMSAIGVILELEVGVISGEHSTVPADPVGYTQAADFCAVLNRLGPCRAANYLLAPSFGNVHGSAQAAPRIEIDVLRIGQHIAMSEPESGSPFLYVYHGGSGTSEHTVQEAIAHGVVKFNVDTDALRAYTAALGQSLAPICDRPLIKAKKDEIDPRIYGRAAEDAMSAQVVRICESVGSAGRAR